MLRKLLARQREFGKDVPPKTLLGVIVEVSLAGGLDTLAAFSEGGVRYVNQSGKLVVIEAAASMLPTVKDIFVAAEPVVARLGLHRATKLLQDVLHWERSSGDHIRLQ
jgi:hypothetical protein